MNLPYLTGGYSLQPGSLTAVTAISAAVCARAGTAEDFCSLTYLSCCQRKPLHLFPILCATSYLVRMTLLREVATPLDEEELFFSQDGGCCSRNRQMAQRSEGVLSPVWCIRDVVSKLCAGPSPWQCTGLPVRGLQLRAAVSSEEPMSALALGKRSLLVEVLEICNCEWSETLIERVTFDKVREMAAVGEPGWGPRLPCFQEVGEPWWGQDNGGREGLVEKDCRFSW